MVDIVIPVHNEERGLRVSVLRLHAYLTQQFPFSARITLADNASTDSTPAVAAELAEELPEVRVLRLKEKGRGRALAAAWLTSDARVVSYMDVDLSTDLSALLPLVAPVISGHSQVSIGSRLVTGSRVTRGPKREVISRVYNILLRLVLRVRFKDAQCGFKALRADVARSLLPDVVNRNWFFDTELLVRAERAGLRIHELPVDWLDDPDSRVDIVATAIEDLRGVWRLATGRPADAPLWLSTQLVRFAAVGSARPSVIGLLAITLMLYVWGLDRNGWANAYYSAAVQAGSQSWKAFLFGSLDASNFITVDKSPGFLWVMEISARIFGVNTWSIQVPQALEGVATIALTYVMVRRWFGPAAALIAGATVALTPVAALMFRYNNPDALLVLLVTGRASP